MNGIGSHQSAAMLNDEWLTPPHIVNQLGPFDLDPCSPINRPWDTATNHYTLEDNGLTMPWYGFVWLNPPYGRKASCWLERMTAHNNGIALMFARTETEMFFKYVWGHATSLLFLEGRIYFHYVDGTKAKANSGAPSVLIAYGDKADLKLKESNIKGKYVKLK